MARTSNFKFQGVTIDQPSQEKSLHLGTKWSTNFAFNNCFLFSRMCWVDMMNCFLFRKKQAFSNHFTVHISPPFSSQSSVMSVCFARFHPNLVVGGTYSGQIVLWDNRSHRRTPVQRTPLSAAAHTVSQLLSLPCQPPKPCKGMTDGSTDAVSNSKPECM